MTKLYGTVLQSHSAERCEVLPGTSVEIDAAGRIVRLAQESVAGDVIGDSDCWVLPGFVDAHLHLPQWDRRGIDGFSLFDWHQAVVYPAEERLRDPAVAEQITEGFVTTLLAHGTTTAAVFGSPFTEAADRAFEVFARRGYRVIFGKTLNDMNVPADLIEPLDKSLDDSRQLAAKWHGAENGRLSYALSPRMTVCCSSKLLRGVAALAKMLDCYVQTHVAESTAEVHDSRLQHPGSLDDVDVFGEAGLLSARTLLGHGVFLDQQQRKQVADSQTTLVHCPTANLFLESGLMDYVAHRSSGLRIALGSSVAGGYELFMPQVAAAALQTAKAVKVHALPRGAHPVPTPAEAWWLITRGGAEALGLGQRVGALQPGYEADCLVVRPEKWIANLPPRQQISALLYTLKPQHIEHVYIAGRRVGP